MVASVFAADKRHENHKSCRHEEEGFSCCHCVTVVTTFQSFASRLEEVFRMTAAKWRSVRRHHRNHYLRRNERQKDCIKEMCFLILCLLSVQLHATSAHEVDAFHRLQLPGPSSQLQIVPRVEVPMSMAPSIQSGMNIRLPITLKFAGHEMGTASRQSSKSMSPQEVLNSTRSETRVSFYRMMEQASPQMGKVCILRSICEVGQVPAISPATGLLGEILDLFLT